MNRISRYAITLLASLTLFVVSAFAIPEKPKEEKLVNDFAGILSSNTIALLEDSLERVAIRTSTQIAVVTVKSLEGYDVSQFAYEIGETWGIGGAKHDNGVVIVVKPKTSDSKGQAHIATGYGVEGVLPDIICGRIVRNTMIPYFMNNDYNRGISEGVFAVIKYVEGEYTAEPQSEEIDWLAIIFILGIIGLFLYLMFKNGDGGDSSTMNYRRRYRDRISYSNDSFIFGNGGHFGGGGSRGGFGGFGGGHFGGGGGGGSW